VSNTKKIKAGLVLQEPSEFIGHAGTLFYNPDTGSMYLSDGVTPGGISLGQGGGGGGFSGNYADLTNKPNLQVYATNTYVDNKTTWGNITSKPSFAAVATSGSYNDLTNKPSIPSLSGYATESYVSSAVSGKVDSSSLATVATSGNYHDLEYLPTISTVGTTGNYEDLRNKPSIPSVVGLATENYVTSQGYITSSALSSYATQTWVEGKNYLTSASLSSYATTSWVTDQSYVTTDGLTSALSGYASTSDIPANTSDLNNDSGFITTADLPDLSGYALSSSVPTKTSDLTNDSGFVTSADLPTVNAADRLVSGDYEIVLGTDGVLTTGNIDVGNLALITVPGGDAITSYNSKDVDIFTNVGDGAYSEVWIHHEGNVEITTNGGQLSWNFDTTGNLVLPPVDASALSVTSGIVFSDGTFQNTAAISFSGSYNDLTNTPTLFSGSYTDLTNKPTELPSQTNGFLQSLNGSLSWGNPTSITEGTITDSQIIWTGGSNSSLVDEPEFSRVSLITDQNGDSDGYVFGFGYDGILRVPGQIYDASGRPVINRETQFEYKEYSDFDAEFNKRYIVRTQNNPVTVTLPSTGLVGGEAIFFADAYNTFSVENPLIITGGYIGDSVSDTFAMDTPGSYIGVFYTGNGRWRVYAQGPVTGGGNFSGSYLDLSNKPSIPSSLSDLGITAGSDGQVLTLNSSLVPVWSTPSSSGGTTDRLVNGDYSFVLDEHGGIVATNGSIGPTQAGEFGFGADTGADAVIKANGGFSTWTFKSDNTLQLPAGGDIVDSNGTSVLGGGGASTGNITFSDTTMTSTNGSIYIGFEPSASPAVSFSFTDNGILSAPTIQTGSVEAQGSVKIGDANISTTSMVTCPPNVDTIVYTGTNQLTTTIKALFHVEGNEDGTQSYEAQSCEMMVAQISGRVAGSVYGLAYTSTTPLATFNARIDSSYLIEITCRPTSTTETVYVITHATEMFTTP
jgi:hypothetical protein